MTTGYQYDGSQMLTETTNGSSNQYLWEPGSLVRRDEEWPTLAFVTAPLDTARATDYNHQDNFTNRWGCKAEWLPR